MSNNIRVSTSELEVMAQKAMEAIGVASGLDRDGAYATVWCEVRGLEGLAILIRDLDAILGLPSCAGENINALGLSALVVAPIAIDLAMVQDLEVRVTVQPAARAFEPKLESGQVPLQLDEAVRDLFVRQLRGQALRDHEDSVVHPPCPQQIQLPHRAGAGSRPVRLLGK